MNVRSFVRQKGYGCAAEYCVVVTRPAGSVVSTVLPGMSQRVVVSGKTLGATAVEDQAPPVR